MSYTIAQLKVLAKKVAGKACSDPQWNSSGRSQYIRMEGGLLRRTDLHKAIKVLKGRDELDIRVYYPNDGPHLVFTWARGDKQGGLRLRLFEEAQLTKWKPA